MQDHDQHIPAADEIPPPISVSHLVHVLHAYRQVIAVAMGVVVLALLIAGLAFYVLSPSSRVTTLRFRVEFAGAAEGKYPNGTKFSASEIVSTPIVLKVFNDNSLGKFTTFADFSKSLFVLEANDAYEKLVADYQARLSDPKLTPVDRDRLQREYDLKRESLSKNEFSINFVRTDRTVNIPEPIVRKVLVDTLSDWADFAINEQKVLTYRVAVLSPAVVEPSAMELGDPVISLHVLRSKIERVLENIDEIHRLPAAELARSRTDKISLAEAQARLEEIMRFSLEPLIPIARASMPDSTSTSRFLETQLAYDQRSLEAARAKAEQIRQSIAVYSLTERARPDVETSGSSGSAKGSSPEGQTVMPQLSDSFIDRLVTLTANSGDTVYRQSAVNDYRQALLKIIPAEEAVTYDKQVIEEMRAPARSSGKFAPDFTRTQIENARSEVRRMLVNVSEIHQELSRHLTPSTELFSTAGTPVTRIDRGASLARLFVIGLLLALFSLAVIVAGCLFHNRVREEEATQQAAAVPA